jgi:hypothetical protein
MLWQMAEQALTGPTGLRRRATASAPALLPVPEQLIEPTIAPPRIVADAPPIPRQPQETHEAPAGQPPRHRAEELHPRLRHTSDTAPMTGWGLLT